MARKLRIVQCIAISKSTAPQWRSRATGSKWTHSTSIITILDKPQLVCDLFRPTSVVPPRPPQVHYIKMKPTHLVMVCNIVLKDFYNARRGKCGPARAWCNTANLIGFLAFDAGGLCATMANYSPSVSGFYTTEMSVKLFICDNSCP